MKKPSQNAQQFELDRLKESIKRKNKKIRNLRAKLMKGTPTPNGVVIREKKGKVRPYSLPSTEPKSNLLEMFGTFVASKMLDDVKKAS